MSWEGGFLSDTTIHFNENLNVLVGGRGTGKSTVIESLRYVLGLEPLGEDSSKAHDGVINKVLRSGTKTSLLVRSHRPSTVCYTIEGTIPNQPVVKDETGGVLNLSPREVLPGVELFGQHEISELTKSPEKRTRLLTRFLSGDTTLLGKKADARANLERSRGRIVAVRREMGRLLEQLTTLPSLEETQKRYQEAGLEDLLKEKSQLVTEERLFVELDNRVEPFRTVSKSLTENLPIDSAFVSSEVTKDLPNAEIISEIEAAIQALNSKLTSLSEQLIRALDEADHSISEIKTRWNEGKGKIEEAYAETLRELQKSKIDGEEFIELRKQIETLRPMNAEMDGYKQELADYETERLNLLSDWEDVKAEEFREYERAANRVSGKLLNRVRVKVTMSGERKPLLNLLRDEVGGRLSPAPERLRDRNQLSLQELAQACREGKDVLMDTFNLPAGAADRIANADPEIFMKIEELELPATTEIELNTAPEGEAANWQSLEELSTGQKATAILLLLLLESDAPLIVDQPEDDLDNRFITESVVPIMRQEKRRRQFVFSTHNANIPVLGDAELILGLSAVGEAEEGRARIAPEHMASIDSEPVRDLVEEILEGGKAAFEMRRSKYGF